jgi:F0F1-type ATP synthase assembly protein I
MTTQSQKEQTDESQRLKRSKLSHWVRPVISIIMLILLGLAIAWVLDQLAVIPKPWSDILSKVFPAISGVLGLVLNKDFVQSLIQRIFSSHSDALGTSTAPPQGSIITVSPVITVFPPPEEAPPKAPESKEPPFLFPPVKDDLPQATVSPKEPKPWEPTSPFGTDEYFEDFVANVLWNAEKDDVVQYKYTDSTSEKSEG